MDLPDVLGPMAGGFGPTAPMTAMGDAAKAMQHQQRLLAQLAQLNLLQSLQGFNGLNVLNPNPILSNPMLIAQQQQDALHKLQQSLGAQPPPHQHPPVLFMLTLNALEYRKYIDFVLSEFPQNSECTLSVLCAQ